MTRFTVFGLGEAGGAISTGMIAAGADVAGFDPAPVAAPAGLARFDDPRDAARGADVVLAITPSADARQALDQALGTIPAGALYADLSTSAPGLKLELSKVADGAGLLFADVALMSTVPDKGIRTPALVAGPGAAAFVAAMAPLGMPVESVDGDAGAAATRKLLRSVVLKGFAALLIESMRAANAAGLGADTWANLVDEFTQADEAFLRRMIVGTGRHRERRLHEMEATEAMLAELAVDAGMTRATVDMLRRVEVDGIPALPETALSDTGT